MIFRFGILGFLMGMVVLTAIYSPQVYGEDGVHIVRSGETFYSIARDLGIKDEDLMKFNEISDPARLQVGQRLRIPGSTPASSGTGGYTEYRAVWGDTLYSIARKFSITVDSIREANGLSPDHLLREGDSLRIPTGARIPAEAGIPTEVRIPAEVKAPTETQIPTEIRIPGNAGTTTTGTGPAATVNTPQGGSNNRAADTGVAGSSLSWPVNVRELNYMTGKLNGVVITGMRAESVSSLTRGTVLSAGPYRGFGRVVIVQVDGGYLYVYGGCESLSVKEGDRIGPGTELGRLGVDAISNKPQLFFMVYKSNTPVDPAKAPRA